ncbi:hypothetical protein GCM10018954_043890 [Kutzneria kofuensis]
MWGCGGEKLVFTVDSAAEKVRDRLGSLAEVVTAPDRCSTGTPCWRGWANAASNG